MIAARTVLVFSCCAFSVSAQWIDYPAKGIPRTRDGSFGAEKAAVANDG
jgi:hypothetical protein